MKNGRHLLMKKDEFERSLTSRLQHREMYIYWKAGKNILSFAEGE